MDLLRVKLVSRDLFRGHIANEWHMYVSVAVDENHAKVLESQGQDR
jgi:hypothetical protein